MENEGIRSRLEAVLLTLLLPGSGHWALGKKITGLILFMLCTAASSCLIYFLFSSSTKSLVPAAISLGGLLALWIIAVVMAALQTPAEKAKTGLYAWAGFLNLLVPGVGHYIRMQWFTGLGFFAAAALVYLGKILGPELLWISWGPTWPFILNALLALITTGAVYLALVRPLHSDEVNRSKPFKRILLLALVLHQGLLLTWKGSVSIQPSPSGYMYPTFRTAMLLPDERTDFASDGNSFWRLAFKGERIVTYHAEISGTIDADHEAMPDRFIFYINGVPFSVPADFTVHVQPGNAIEKGQLWASAIRKTADHLLISRASYLLSNPKRGDVVLASTDGLGLPELGRKPRLFLRVAGLPGEKIRIRPPAIYANETRITEPPIFNDIAGGKDEYRGFNVASPINFPVPIMITTDDFIILGEDEYFLVGDFHPTAKDSRFMGGIPLKNILGKASRILWPLDRTSTN